MMNRTNTKSSLPSSGRSSSSSALASSNANVIETTTIVRDYDQETGNKMINNYMIIGELGRGTHGKVKLALDIETNEKWAIKIVDKISRKRLPSRLNNQGAQNPQLEKIRKEIAILKKCSHPNVVMLKEVIDDPQADKIYLVLEYLEGGDIIWQDPDCPSQPVIKEEDARRIFRDILNGIEYRNSAATLWVVKYPRIHSVNYLPNMFLVHYQGIVHRDIKPANLLWSSDRHVKLADFGVSLLLNPESFGSYGGQKDDLELAKTAGSPAFFAPELCASEEEIILRDATTEKHSLKRSGSALEVGSAIDVWAIGVTLYCIVFAQLPFVAETEFELFNIIPNQDLTFPSLDVNPDLRDLLQKLLEKNPTKRITVSDAKLHPWTTADMSGEARLKWLASTNRTQFNDNRVHVSEDDLNSAFTVVKRIKRQLRKISASFHNFTQSFRRRSVSMPSVNETGSMKLPKHQSNPSEYHERQRLSYRKPPTIPPPLMPHLPVAFDMQVHTETQSSQAVESPRLIGRVANEKKKLSQSKESPSADSSEKNVLSPRWARWHASPTDSCVNTNVFEAEHVAGDDDDMYSDGSDDIVALERERIRQWNAQNHIRDDEQTI